MTRGKSIILGIWVILLAVVTSGCLDCADCNDCAVPSKDTALCFRDHREYYRDRREWRDDVRAYEDLNECDCR